MHELSIATAILDSVAREVSRHGGVRPTKVGVRIGELSGVDPDALSFGFEALVKDSAWEPLTLEIEFCPRRQRCPACGSTFAAKNFEIACPQCGAASTECISGNELDIAYLEVEESWSGSQSNGRS